MNLPTDAELKEWWEHAGKMPMGFYEERIRRLIVALLWERARTAYPPEYWLKVSCDLIGIDFNEVMKVMEGK